MLDLIPKVRNTDMSFLTMMNKIFFAESIATKSISP